jgi:hypothetical protein
MPATWVAIVPVGRSYAIAKDEMPKLEKLLPGSKVESAEPAPKNAPGVVKARQWAEEHTAALQDCQSADDFLETLNAAKARWVKIRHDYPGIWTGPENSGLVNDAKKIARVFGVVDSYDTFIDMVEGLAADAKDAA